MSQFSLGHLLLGNDPKQNFPQGCSEECTRLPKHNGNCQLAPPVHSHLPLNSGCGKDQNISLVPLEIRFYHLDALLWNLESGKEMEHLRTESGKEMEHHRKVSCSNRSEDSSSWLLRGNKSHHRGSGLAISSFGWWVPGNKDCGWGWWWQVTSSTSTSGWQREQWVLPAHQVLLTLCKHSIPCV